MSLRPLAWIAGRIPSSIRRAFTGFWVVPLAFGVAGGATGLAWQYAPEAVFIRLLPERAARIDPAGARAILSVVATSVMSLVSIVLSLTFVALSLTAQLLSPRMLDAVLRERAIQVLIGFALAAFLFSSISLSISEGEHAWRLFLAAPVSLALAAMTLVSTVVFIHRITLVMRPDEMVAQRAAAFLAAARRVSEPPEGCVAASPGQAEALDDALGEGERLKVDLAGYVGRIDWSALVDLARKHDARLAVDVLENDFLTPGATFGRALRLPREAAAEAAGALNLTTRRVPASSAVYEAQALSEGAIRALSPGINDPGTALSCIDRLFEGAFVIADAPPPAALADEAGAPRALRAVYGVSELLERALAPILHYVADDPRLLDRMRTLADALEPKLERAENRRALAALRRRVEAKAETVGGRAAPAEGDAAGRPPTPAVGRSR